MVKLILLLRISNELELASGNQEGRLLEWGSQSVEDLRG